MRVRHFRFIVSINILLKAAAEQEKYPEAKFYEDQKFEVLSLFSQLHNSTLQRFVIVHSKNEWKARNSKCCFLTSNPILCLWFVL